MDNYPGLKIRCDLGFGHLHKILIANIMLNNLYNWQI